MENALKASTDFSSRNSSRATGAPAKVMSCTALTASLIVSKATTPEVTNSGIGWSLTVIFVISPSVPSAPINREVRS